ncbi:MAG: ribose-phosphate diphosphokinase [Candidatus Thermoplasmatota archaeon]|nr:ribose-phosphate diphosphokinase [Candidatus Thermoplasmatota archaeon]
MRILCGSSNPSLCTSLSKELDAGILNADIRRFPDGELYARLLEDITGETVLIVQSTYPDDNALEMLMLSSMTRDNGASRVIGVIPYFGYARQDRVFKEGESFAARTMARHLSLSLSDVICVNLHKQATLEEFGTAVGKRNVSVMSELGGMMKGRLDLVLSPDKGAITYAAEAARTAGCPFDHLEKTRIDGSTVTMARKELDVDGKDVCIVDDIIATGSTIARASEALREQGARKVFACCVHGLFTGGGRERLEHILDGLFSSDTIENQTTAFSATAPVARAVKELTGGA